MVALLVSAGEPIRQDSVAAAGGPRPLLEQRLGLFAGEALADADRTLTAWRDRGISTLACSDRRFPPGLKAAGEAPALLLLRGTLAPADAGGIAIVGTRSPSQNGIESATQVAGALAGAGRTVISGLAAGIDAAAHAAALARGGRTVAVVGHGLDHAYPEENRQLATRLSARCSAYLPDSPPAPERFRQRNLLIAALATALVVIEAGPRSGARIAARHARRLGRPVILWRSQFGDDWMPGPGVRVVSEAQEVLRALLD